MQDAKSKSKSGKEQSKATMTVRLSFVQVVFCVLCMALQRRSWRDGLGAMPWRGNLWGQMLPNAAECCSRCQLRRSAF